MNRLKSFAWLLLLVVLFLAWSDGRDSAVGFARGIAEILAIVWDAIIEFVRTFGNEAKSTPEGLSATVAGYALVA